MKCTEALQRMLDACAGNAVCLFTNGFISRFAYLARDRELNFYMVGSMGLASSLGLGIALNTRRRVIVFDGDGSALMNLGMLPVIGNRQPANLVHVVLDNSCYASTGGQPCVSRSTDLCAIARGAGYRRAVSLGDRRQLARSLAGIYRARGPLFVHLRVEPELSTPRCRVRHSPEELATRLRRKLAGPAGRNR